MLKSQNLDIKFNIIGTELQVFIEISIVKERLM